MTNKWASWVAVDERSKLYRDKIIYIIGQCLLLVRECAHPPKPFISVALGIESIYSLPLSSSQEECQKILWSQVRHHAMPSMTMPVLCTFSVNNSCLCAEHEMRASISI